MRKVVCQVTCDGCGEIIEVADRPDPGTAIAIDLVVRQPDLCPECYQVLVMPLLSFLTTLPAPRANKQKRRARDV